jgi:hypothetical protein
MHKISYRFINILYSSFALEQHLVITSLCDCILHILDGVREAIKSFVGAQKSSGWHDTYHMKLCDLRSYFDASVVYGMQC